MKNTIVLLMLLVAGYSFSQSVNDYQAVLIPMKYEFQKSENQYRLQTNTKYNLEKAGFISFYSNYEIPAQYDNRCSLLYLDVVEEKAFLATKLYVVFKDCNGNEIFKSASGRSKEKEYDLAYKDALNDAFKSITKLEYSYNGGAAVAKTKQVVAANKNANEKVSTASLPVSISNVDPNLNVLYAQPTDTGFQLIDKTPKVVMKLLKTATPNSFIAIKGDVQGVLSLKDNQWVFDSYQNNTLVSEVISVKF